MTESPKPKLTLKQKKFITEVAKGKSGTQAALIAYDTTSVDVAKNIASETLRKPNVQEALAVAFEKHGITLDKAIKPIADGLVADKVHIVGNGEQAMAEIAPDHSIRLKASGMALRLMGADSQETAGNTYNFVQVVQDQKDKYGL